MFDRGNEQLHLDTINKLKLILSTLQEEQEEGTVQCLLKSDKAIKETIMANKDAMDFLKLINFNFEFSDDEIVLVNRDVNKVQMGLDAINTHFSTLNNSYNTATQQVTGNFDMYQHSDEGKLSQAPEDDKQSDLNSKINSVIGDAQV